MSVRKLTRIALLTAIALIVFVIEMQIPPIVPVPGAKLGLANVVTVFAVYTLSAGETAMILIARILLGAVFAGNPTALIMSFSGGLLCLLGMLLLRRVIDRKHIWVCSILGAVLHNIGQTAAAAAVMQTTAVISYLPYLTAAGCIAGALTGIISQLCVSRLSDRMR